MKIALLLLVGACGFAKLPKLSGSADAPGGGDAPADVPADTAAPDAGACQAASVECASSDTLRSCSAAGSMAVDTACNWGCVATGTAHCGLLQPTGGAATTTDTDTATLATLGDAMISGAINSDTGSIGTTRASGTGIIGGIDYEQRGTVAVFRVKSAVFVSGGTVTVTGTRSVVFIADTSLSVDGTLDLRGNCLLQTAPGGFPGGGNQGAGAGPGAGQPAGGGSGGGGGGGHGGRGGASTNGGLGGVVNGDAVITMLAGGSGGAGGGGNSATGGHGGGAIQLIANGTLTITGGINAGGCGGHTGGTGGGGGGGAGGTIVLEAATVHLLGALAVNGGGGAGGGNGGSSGGDATLDRQPALGGVSPQNATGGNGGAANLPDGSVGAFSGSCGGGGGGVGRIRVNTPNGAATIDAHAVLSPGPNDANTTFTQGPAIIR